VWIPIETPYSDFIEDISIITWLGKNRRSDVGGVWESDFRFLRGNFFGGASCKASLRG